MKVEDRLIKSLRGPATGNRIVYDDTLSGFGVRITAAGVVSFVMNYRFENRERRITIGRYGKDLWTVARARKRAGELRSKLDKGEDPLAEKITAREAPTVATLAGRFEEDFLPEKRASTQREYRAIIRGHILPAMGDLKVAKVTKENVRTLHRAITKQGTPYRANRVIATLSRMFSFAMGLEPAWRTDNPVRGTKRNAEEPRTRYLTGEEMGRLTSALNEHADQQAANVIRMLLLTGARRGEVQSMKWTDVDLGTGVWVKPAARTKQRKTHRVPLSAPARQLLAELRETVTPDAEFVFPSHGGRGYRIELKDNWAALCKAANISGARMHDLRHTYASVLASAGLSLPIIGALLGHTQAQTTQRYAHLFDDPLRAATERVGAIVTSGNLAEVVSIRKRG